ncbi:beta-N-acetylhexosaminidase [Acidisoma cellulosilytica]|uniref:beta-N-acetylhexosaminidase n=1 Tax=Acidisoma cellulosilyticum TaxID=2802395 RepID=A0A963Z071_9PROT|nr:beta-N-acetylhexosaminidase [Acidisoma cellulosilyticum]MCB8880432.1 beta-N-acetylhexosaminidase [Acidisoma cellulosilyticum]
MKPAILGVSGPDLTGAEADLFRQHPPAGIILFGRNVQDPVQLARLTGDLRAVLSADAVIMVDQEGGRVARLRPPHWAGHPACGVIADLWSRVPAQAERAAWLQGAAIGAECRANGFDMVAAPVLDLAVPGQNQAVVGDRSFGADPQAVAVLGRAMAQGLLAAGVIPVAKHVPGHGRAKVDSHHHLPVVEASGLAWEQDREPFRILAAEFACMMTAHILFAGIDDDRPATLSQTVIGSVIRQDIGFRGLLLSDDLAMHALSGTPLERAQASLAAGCDIALFCPGDADGNRAILEALPSILDLGRRLGQMRPVVAPLDLASLLTERQNLLEGAL